MNLRLAGTFLLAVSIPARAEGPADRIAAAVREGSLHVEIALGDGRVPMAKGFSLETRGRPLLALDGVAREGRIVSFCAVVPQGTLLVRGSGLRPDFRIDELTVAEDGSIAKARYQGVGGWSRFVLSLFGGVAKKQLAKVRFRTEVPALLRGELLADEEPARPSPAAPPSAPPVPPPVSAPAAPSKGAAFLRLVDQVRVVDSEIAAFPGRELEFGEVLRFTTASEPPIRLRIREAVFHPEETAGIPAYRLEGSLSGGFENGTILWEKDRVLFSRGTLDAGSFLLEEGFASRTDFRAARLALELSSGLFRLPSGVSVAVEAPSRFAARDVEVSGAGVRALLDLDLEGRTGEIRREGSVLTLGEARVKTRGLRVARGRTDGDVDLSFDYRLLHPFVVRYPVEGLAPKTVPLEFRGPFAATLHLASVGAGARDAVTGRYTFSVNWPPIEKAASEVLKARWMQDVGAIRRVVFEIEPQHFAPCGEGCFVASFTVQAAKQGSKRFSIRCTPEGRATLVVDKDARAFLLKDLKTEPHCEGLVGKLVNLVAPLLAKTYEDLVLFRLPEGLPFRIDRVSGDERALTIAGEVDWRERPAAPATNQPATP